MDPAQEARKLARARRGAAALTWPTDRLAPSSSITVSKLNRFTGVCAPLGVSSSFVAVAECSCFTSSTRYARFSASQSVASSFLLNGSRLDRRVPETNHMLATNVSTENTAGSLHKS